MIDVNKSRKVNASELARRVGKSRETIWRYMDQGRAGVTLPCEYAPSGERLCSVAEYEAWCRKVHVARDSFRKARLAMMTAAEDPGQAERQRLARLANELAGAR